LYPKKSNSIIGEILETSDILQLVILVLLLSASAFFSSAETALMTSNKLRIRNLAENGDKRAEKVLEITANTDKMLSAILIGNNIVNLSASALSTTLTLKMFGSSLVGIATGILTFLILVFGEITPKNVASKNAENIALKYIGIISVLVVILTPAIYIVNKVAGIVISLFIKNNDDNNMVTEDELRAMVEVSHEDGVIEKEEGPYRVGIITVSDRASKGEYEDKSGPVIKELVEAAGMEVVDYIIVPDEKSQIAKKLLHFSDQRQVDLVFTTGGTGFSKRDVTPEATKQVVEREVPGIGEALRSYSLTITPKAMLSRQTAGIRGNTLIINLPGSPKACKENIEYILTPLKHGLGILSGRETN